MFWDAFLQVTLFFGFGKKRQMIVPSGASSVLCRRGYCSCSGKERKGGPEAEMANAAAAAAKQTAPIDL